MAHPPSLPGLAVRADTATAEEIARLRAMADAWSAAGSPGGPPLVAGAILLAVSLMLAIADLAFGLLEREDWIVFLLGAVLIALPTVLLQERDRRRSRPAREATAGRLRAAADAGEVQRWELLRGPAHWILPHEHGTIVLSPAGPGRTLCLDLCSVSDDPRHEAWLAPGRIHRARWRWTTTPDGETLLSFEADGDPLPQNDAEALGLGTEDAMEIFEALGSPGDGDLIERDFAEVDGIVRARIALPGDGGPAVR